MTRRKSFLFLVCALPLLLACSNTSTLHSGTGARTACREYATAKIKALYEERIGGFETFQVTPVESHSGCYVVTEHVNIKNVLGSTRRTYYVCTVCFTGERYRLEALTVR